MFFSKKKQEMTDPRLWLIALALMILTIIFFRTFP